MIVLEVIGAVIVLALLALGLKTYLADSASTGEKK